MAAILLSLALIFGTIIGARYRVAAMILALPMAIGIAGWLAIRLTPGIPAMLAWQIVTLVGLQVGYLAGALLATRDQRPLTRA